MHLGQIVALDESIGEVGCADHHRFDRGGGRLPLLQNRANRGDDAAAHIAGGRHLHRREDVTIGQ